jgi:hypothetical protein
MTALTLLRDGVATAAQLASLLFVAPAFAAPAVSVAPPTSAHENPAVATAAASASTSVRDLLAVTSALEVHLLGSLADVRIVQTVHNAGTRPIDLGARLPVTDEHVEQLRIERAGRSVDLMAGLLDGCGGDEAATSEGHVQAALDEALADVLELPAGQQATIEIVATHVLERHADAYRLALPSTMLPLDTQALLVGRSDRPVLIVVPPADARGDATLTLRPAGSAPEVIALGLTDRAAFAIVLADATALDRLAAGVVELEIVNDDRLLWTSLLPTVHRADIATIVQSAR